MCPHGSLGGHVGGDDFLAVRVGCGDGCGETGGGAHSAFCRQLPAASLFEDPAARGTACGRLADGHELRSRASPSVGAVVPFPCRLTAEPLPPALILPPSLPILRASVAAPPLPPPRSIHPPIGQRFITGEASQRSGEGRLSAETRRSANRKPSGSRSVGCALIFLVPVLLSTLLVERPAGRQDGGGQRGSTCHDGPSSSARAGAARRQRRRPRWCAPSWRAVWRHGDSGQVWWWGLWGGAAGAGWRWGGRG